MAIKFEDINVGKKLGLGFFLVLLMTLIIAGTGMRYFISLQENLEKVNLSNQVDDEINQAKYYRALYTMNYSPETMQQNAAHIENIKTLIVQAGTMRWSAADTKKTDDILKGVEQYRQKRQEYLAAVEAKDNVRKTWNISDTMGALQQLHEQLQVTGDSMTQQLLLAELNARLTAIRYHVRGLLLSRDKASEQAAIEAVKEAKNAQSTLYHLVSPQQQKILEPILPILENYEPKITAYIPAYQHEQDVAQQIHAIASVLGDQITALVNEQVALARQNVRTSEIQLAIATLITLLIGILISWFISRQITTPLNQTLAMAERIAIGDLTMNTTTRRRDELCLLLAAMAKMNVNLRNMIDEIRTGVSQISTASGEIVAGNTDLSCRTEQQAAAVEQTAASMEQLTATVKRNTDNAHHANKLAVDASQTAKQCGEQAGQVVHTMTEIEQSSRRIAEITAVINSIAFQTNILALNAAVEAARAGEQGRGFAVVASEVRNLAQRSSQAAKEIAELIDASVHQVTHGATLVNGAGQIINDLVKSVTEVHGIMGDIATASDEQSRGIEQINQAIVEMDSTTQQNAALVEESATAADSLEEQAAALMRTVAVFRLSADQEAAATPAGIAHTRQAPQLSYRK